MNCDVNYDILYCWTWMDSKIMKQIEMEMHQGFKWPLFSVTEEKEKKNGTDMSKRKMNIYLFFLMKKGMQLKSEKGCKSNVRPRKNVFQRTSCQTSIKSTI